MNNDATGTLATRLDRRSERLNELMAWGPRLLVPAFTLFFLAFALLYAASAMFELVKAIYSDGDLAEGLLKGLHMGVVALAVYELAQVLQEEYDPNGQPADAIRRIRRGVTRFASVVFVALVLESLIMVIKYNQQALAGFLYYPVAIIASAALLLTALGIFIKFSVPVQMEQRPGDDEPRHIRVT